MKKEIKSVSDNLKKTSQSTTEIQPLTINRSWSDFINKDALLLFPGKTEWQKRFAMNLIEWADQEGSYEIQQFARLMKMRRMTIYDWAERYPVIKEAMDEAKLLLASRKRIGAMLKQFDKDVVYKDMHKLDPEYLEINRYHAEQKQLDVDKQAHTFNITLGKPEVVTPKMLKDETDGIK